MLRKGQLRQHLRNEKGAIDLASIMVGVIVIGLIGGVISASIFTVIPWAQDNAAKQQLDSVVAAQSAYMGLSSGTPPVVPSGSPESSYGDSKTLSNAGLLSENTDYCAASTNDGKGYIAFSKSPTGNLWKVTDTNTSPTRAGTWDLSDNCLALLGETPVINPPYNDPTPKRTSITYKCDADTALVTTPIKNGKGTATWNDGLTQTVTGTQPVQRAMQAGTEYTLDFEGTYPELTNFKWTAEASQTVEGVECLRAVNYVGEGTGATNINFAYAPNLIDVPPRLPASANSLSNMFTGSLKINDPDIAKWDVSKVYNFNHMFRQADRFNQPLNQWDTSKATTMHYMFRTARDFNQPLNNWNVSKVRAMESMFDGATVFNQPLDKWDTSEVRNFTGMFVGSAFQHDVSHWNTANMEAGTNFASGNYPAEYLPKGTTKG